MIQYRDTRFANRNENAKKEALRKRHLSEIRANLKKSNSLTYNLTFITKTDGS